MASAGSGLWGLIAHRPANLVATVAAMPDVAKVEVVKSEAGAALQSAATAVALPTAVVTMAAKP